jgi:hypothetical protein
MTHTASSNVPYGALPKNVSGAGIVEHGRIFLVFCAARDIVEISRTPNSNKKARIFVQQTTNPNHKSAPQHQHLSKTLLAACALRLAAAPADKK